MQYMILIYETPQDFEARKAPGTNPYIAAWRAYHQAVVKSGAYVGGESLRPACSSRSLAAHPGSTAAAFQDE